MKGRRAAWGLLLLLPVLALSAPGLGATDAVRHITLDASTPGDGEQVAGEVHEIRLFFSGAPLLRGASVRILTSSRSLVRSSPPAADPEDPTQLFVTVDETLAPGAYVIQWRCIADDGHVMRGDFRFEVTAE